MRLLMTKGEETKPPAATDTPEMDEKVIILVALLYVQETAADPAWQLS